MSFSGFSEDDIKKFKDNTTKIVSDLEKSPAAAKKASLKNNSKLIDKSKRALANHSIIKNFSTTNNGSDLPDNAKLCINTKEQVSDLSSVRDKNSNLVPTSDQVSVVKKEPESKVENKEGVEEQTKNDNSHNETESKCNNKQGEIETIGDIKVSRRRIVDLDEFDAKQKLIEEQNRRRKELLSKALADRTRQTQEEAQRLSEIQSEFRKLDALLSNDVKILRKQIEVASLDYLDAEKKYHKIEKEYLESKLMLHQKRERKQMLTEHLCAIIERNEERKAEKLTELLNKLQFNVQGLTEHLDESLEGIKSDSSIQTEAGQ